MSDLWQATPDTLRLSPEYIDVWICDLRILSKNIEIFYSLLTDDERERANKLKVENKKQEYIITRGSLRQHLGLLINIDPKDLIFEYLKHGKPILAKKSNTTGVTFNVSHSNEFALLAISQQRNIGIDIEKINRDTNHLPLVKRFFSAAEQSRFQAIQKSKMAKAFCACWTRKEAFIKATGDGVFYGLDNFDVCFDPEIQNPKINLHDPSAEKWFAANLPINDEYMACLVSNQQDINVRYWHDSSAYLHRANFSRKNT